MNQQALIEQLAETIYDREYAGFVAGWHQVDEDEADEYRAIAEDYLPVIVAFVADWIERDGSFEDEAVERAARWYREMQPSADLVAEDGA